MHLPINSNTSVEVIILFSVLAVVYHRNGWCQQLCT